MLPVKFDFKVNEDRRGTNFEGVEAGHADPEGALVIEPEVVWLDEPTANIDPQNTEIIEQIILDMKTAGKSTIIVVTHDPAQARRLGDHLLVMEYGKIVSR